MKNWFRKIFLPDSNPRADNAYCRLGLHGWDPILAECWDCGMPDRLLDPGGYKKWQADSAALTQQEDTE